MTGNLTIQGRGAIRSRTRIFGTVHYFNQSITGRVVDLSETGMALELEGTVQWQHGNRLGLRLQLSSNTLAQLSSYFRFFHEEVKPTLAG